jgi:proline racemase
MSGSNSICVATVVLEIGIVPMREPVTELVLEAPGGLVRAIAKCRNGKVESVRIHNVPSFAHKLDQTIEVAGTGTVTLDTAFGGDSFAIIDADALGFDLVPGEARQLADLGMQITAAANEQVGFAHPTNPDWRHISFCLFAGPLEESDGDLLTRHAVAIRPGKIDRSPTGTGVSARLAVLRARDQIKAGQRLVATSIIDSTFIGRIESQTMIGDTAAIVPSIEGRAWTTGRKELWCDPADPWPEGYRVTDTWP